MNYHGEVGARLDANRSVHGSPAPRVNVFMNILFLLLFNNPARYLKNIHDIHTDGVVKEVTWRKHMEDFRNSWREYILYVRHVQTLTNCSTNTVNVFLPMIGHSSVECQRCSIGYPYHCSPKSIVEHSGRSREFSLDNHQYWMCRCRAAAC